MAPQVLLAPEELALALSRQMALHGADVVFLASNAKPDEVAALRAALQREVLLRSTPDARRADAAASANAAAGGADAVRADDARAEAGASVVDVSAICALCPARVKRDCKRRAHAHSRVRIVCE